MPRTKAKRNRGSVSLRAINRMYKAASACQAEARKSPQNAVAYCKASEKFRLAAGLCRDAAPHAGTLDKVQLLALIPYYSYEAERCLSYWHYECHETAKASRHHLKAERHLQLYITKLEQYVSSDNAELAEHFGRLLARARFSEESDRLVYGSIEARAAWDRDDAISALDRYRSLIAGYQRLVDLASTLGDAATHRITMGNYGGMLANSVAVMAKRLVDSYGLSGVIPVDVAVHCMRYLLDARRASLAAFEANPEWGQYLELAESYRDHVEQLLADNKPQWAGLYGELSNDQEVIKLMRKLDRRLLRTLEGGHDVPKQALGPALLSRESLLKHITRALDLLRLQVESNNALRLCDINIIGEQFFARLLNVVYNLKLENLNATCPNHAAVDLGDKTKRKAIQVTSDGTKKKVRTTLQLFRDHKLHADYDSLAILIIGRRVGRYDGLHRRANPRFDPKTDVKGIRELVKDISGLPVATLTAITEILSEEMETNAFYHLPEPVESDVAADAAMVHRELIRARPARQQRL